MSDMPRPRPPFLLRDVSRHGQVRWYFRKDGKRTRLPDAYGSAEFMTAYQAALAGKPVPAAPKPGAGTLSWLAARYMETAAWSKLSKATRRQRSSILQRTLDAAGAEAAESITGKVIEKSLAVRAETPFAARNFLETMRGLFRWAHKAGHVNADPTAGIVADRPKTDGFAVWSEEDCDEFEARWPLGTRERLAFDVLIYTGLRRGDAVRIGRQHVKEGLLTVRTEKTGETVSIPVLPALAASIAAGPCGDLHFIVGVNGRPMTKESFGNWFREVCNATGLPKRTAHGLRKRAATRLAEAGATVAQLEAWFGWTGGGMASLYTRKANRKKLAESAAGLLSHPVLTATVNAKNKTK